MTNEELIREFLSKWRHHKRRMYAHEILTEDDLLPDDMWLEKHLTVITTAHQKELQKAREEAIVAIFSGATIEYKGRFFKISDQDALNFIQWRQANLTNSQE